MGARMGLEDIMSGDSELNETMGESAERKAYRDEEARKSADAHIRALCEAAPEERTVAAVYRVVCERNDLRAAATPSPEGAVALAVVSKIRALVGAMEDEATDDVVIVMLEQHRRMREFIQRHGEITFGPLRKEGDAISLGITDPLQMGQELGQRFADMLNHMHAQNYVEMRFAARDPGETLTVTVQRHGKVTPANARLAAEGALARAVALLAANGIAWDEPMTFAPPVLPVRERDPETNLGWIRLDVKPYEVHGEPAAMVCDRCGRRQALPDEHTADMMKAMTDAFAAKHGKCPPKDAAEKGGA